MQKTSSAKFLYFLLVMWSLPLVAHVDWENLPLSDKLKKSVASGEFHISSELKNLGKAEKQQELIYSITGLHPSSCEMALPRLSLYEKYKDYLGFVLKSEYSEEDKLIQLLLGHTVLPFKMGLDFKLPRLSGPGTYGFTFSQGFLSGLKGEIHVSQHQNRCLFHSTASWEGPHTGISPKVFSFFSTTLSRMAMHGLFRATMAL